ncbi:hypothetical protein ZHAS_00022106 [Anopheles sinensis]|uniref:Uncharacterized protein n=1 Tax=Anopheles sinensis TaxID=74873 RepID=A0A084WU34_ANOSI|nr:hypothetical protein ZHAS_00022106 [Anopheles sinensis]
MLVSAVYAVLLAEEMEKFFVSGELLHGRCCYAENVRYDSTVPSGSGRRDTRLPAVPTPDSRPKSSRVVQKKRLLKKSASFSICRLLHVPVRCLPLRLHAGPAPGD